MATALTPSSQIALRATVSLFCFSKWDVDIEDVLRDVRYRLPIMGLVVERSDISRALRAAKFVRDHDAGRNAWKHRDRDHPRWGKAAAEDRAAYRAEVVL
jgi:hypothetical protein